jgi:long-subunit fatty acid transport protein
VLLLTMSFAAQAAGLDLIEVGGAWGTPGATNPTAIWWNPAGLAVGGGTQFIVEGAPVFAKVYADRANPPYGELDPPSDSYPDTYDYSGRDEVSLNAVVPFIGVSSDFGVDGLGIGAGLAVPTATGGAIEDEWGPNRYSLRSGDIRAVQAILGASYRIKELVSIGASANLVESSWSADTDTSTYVDLYDAIRDMGIEPTSFRDGYIENRGYTATADFQGLTDRALTFGTGIYVTPIEQLGISLAFNKGVRLDHTGDVQLRFQCPPEYDFLVAFAASDRGLCNNETGEGAVFDGAGSVGYSLPSRINLGIVLHPVEALRLELMGSWVNWKVFTDYEIKTEISPDQVPVEPDDPEDPDDVAEAQAVREETAELASQDLLWARDGRNTYWVGLDAKHRVNELFMYGGRVFYDRTSVPTDSLMLNNFNASTVGLSAMAMVSPIDKLGISISFSHHFMAERTVENSNFGLTIVDEDRRDIRYRFPSGNGTYGGSINRLGIALRGRFGHDKAKW